MAALEIDSEFRPSKRTPSLLPVSSTIRFRCGYYGQRDGRN